MIPKPEPLTTEGQSEDQTKIIQGQNADGKNEAEFTGWVILEVGDGNQRCFVKTFSL